MTITGNADDMSIEEYARENKDELLDILRHSDHAMGRAYAWTILDVGLSDPEIEQLEEDLQKLKEKRGMS